MLASPPIPSSARRHGSILPFLLIFVVMLCQNVLISQAQERPSNLYGADDLPEADDGASALESRERAQYSPEWLGFARSISGRQSTVAATSLQNNIPASSTIFGGGLQQWIFPLGELAKPLSTEQPVLPVFNDNITSNQETTRKMDLRRRQAVDYTYHITLNVCDQPTPTGGNPTGPPPPLDLYVSISLGNTAPGPQVNAQQAKIPTQHGYGEWTNTASTDLHFAVSAPADGGFTGAYNYQVVVSVDEPYSTVRSYQSLFFLDSDTQAGIFVTTNLTAANATAALHKQWMAEAPPFTIFVHHQDDTQISGLTSSWCGLMNHAEIRGSVNGTISTNVSTSMTVAGGGLPKQHLYVQNLTAASDYVAILGLESNYTTAGAGHPGGGGTLWPAVGFRTKTDDSCQVIWNLGFCDNIAYAVPANLTAFNATSLAQQYDTSANASFQYFLNALDQVPCTTGPDAQYSLARTCDDCRAAYKQWLCAVSIPRCADFSSPASKSYLQPRRIGVPFANGTNLSATSTDTLFSADNLARRTFAQSRNPTIDAVVAPGPYKEVLPCQGLCYELVQSCPASLMFACPFNHHGLEASYGTVQQDVDGAYKCSAPGAFWGVSAATTVAWPRRLLVLGMIVAMGVSA